MGNPLKLATLIVALAFFMVPQVYAQAQPEQGNREGAFWFNKMAAALRSLNFEAAIIYVQRDQVEPYRWLHGADSNGEETELVIRLNGPDFRAIRIGDSASYFIPSGNSYTVNASSLFGLIPPAFYQSFEEIADDYHVVAVGGARVLDRKAQYIRVLSNDGVRYGYSVWVDKETGMLLKATMVSAQGEVIEQLQLASLRILDGFPGHLADLSHVPKPPQLTNPSHESETQYQLEPTWSPQGYERLRQDHHRVLLSGNPVDYYLYSDGLSDYSVYITPVEQGDVHEWSIEGTETLYTELKNQFRVTIVGKIPLAIAHRVAAEVRMKVVEERPDGS
ncbi:MucB/RseB C-terminal domain-containing protein [Idiomarina tyrosinivorans]|nr:MucB/RseB C-terminal domain-containing protein [Idiomarina tyrosinivorans]